MWKPIVTKTPYTKNYHGYDNQYLLRDICRSHRSFRHSPAELLLSESLKIPKTSQVYDRQ